MIAESLKSGSTRSVSSSYANFDGGIVRASRDPTRRTLEDVRFQVAQEVGVRAITQAKLSDGIQIGVSLILSTSDSDLNFLTKVADVIGNQLILRDHLFALGTTGSPSPPTPTNSTPSPSPSPTTINPLIITGSSQDFIQRAILLASSKFIGRIKSLTVHAHRWTALITDLGSSLYDEAALYDIVRKAAAPPMDPLAPPPGSRGIAQILSDARARLQRLTPSEAFKELKDPGLHGVGALTFLVDIRTRDAREREGRIEGAVVVERGVLEWCFDPRSERRLPIADRYDLRVIVFCEDGDASSLAAYSLHQLGLLSATDVIGGFRAWRAAGLPAEVPRARSLLSLEGLLV